VERAEAIDTDASRAWVRQQAYGLLSVEAQVNALLKQHGILVVSDPYAYTHDRDWNQHKHSGERIAFDTPEPWHSINGPQEHPL
jgi:hypothetical protein